MMKCRIDISGKKTWIDGDNAYGTRPASVDITLLRDGTAVDSVTLSSASNGNFRFPCLVVRKNSKEDYAYQIDELTPPAGYTKRIQGTNVINTLDNITIDGQKIWEDNYNAGGLRPDTVTVRLFQNGVEVDTVDVAKPLDTEDTVPFTFGEAPFVDATGVPYVYTIDEAVITGYKKTVRGFTIINTLIPVQP